MASDLKDTGCQKQAHGQADPGGGPCPRCGRPRCSASAKTRDGERCRKNPHPGATICTNHGLTEAGRARAADRVAEDQATETIAKLWPGLGSASPVKDPVGSMERLAGALEEMLERTGAKVNDLSHVSAGRDLTQLRGELVLLDKVTGHLRALLESMARLGIAERYVQLEEERASIVVAAFVGALEVLVLVPADKDLVTRRFLELLGDVVPGEVVAS